MNRQDEILEIIRKDGPLLAITICKRLSISSTFAGAYLSELKSSNKIKISDLKIGTSPLYYLSQQESKLEQFSKYLNEKDLKTYTILKEKVLLKDGEQDPLIRVSLRNIPDFAYPINVNLGQGIELFWKYYLCTNEQAEKIIRERFIKKEEIKVPDTLPVNLEIKSNKEIQGESEGTSDANIDSSSQEITPVHKSINTEIKTEDLNKVKKKYKENKKVKKEIPVEKEMNIQESNPQQPLVDDAFLISILSYFKANSIIMNYHKIIKPNTEIDFTISIPTQIGELTYFCKAKNKKRLSEADLSAALLSGQTKNMPVIFLSPGILSKSCQALLKTDLQSIIFRQV